MKKIKIALIGIYYPLAMLRYFERALERRDDIELITIGPYTGTWIPWNGSMNLHQKYAKSPDHPLPMQLIQLGKVNPALFQSFSDIHDVDLWLEVDAGFYLDPRPINGIVAHVGTDPHVLSYDRQRQLADYFFCMQTPYMKNGDWWLPYAYDPTVHFPMDIDKEMDACLIGLHYPQRDQLVNKLRSRGLKVYYDLGPIFDEYRLLNNRSKIGLNWSSMLDMNARCWELAGMGICSVMNHIPDMDTFFVKNEHYLAFNTLEEAEKQVMLALSDDEMRIEIAQSAWRKVQPQTYDSRIQQILETVKLL